MELSTGIYLLGEVLVVDSQGFTACRGLDL